MSDASSSRISEKESARPVPLTSVARRVQRWVRNRSAQRASLALADQAVVSATSFFTSVLIGRNCSAEQLGVYYLALSVVLFLIGIQSELITAPYTVFRQRKQGRALATYSGSTLLHQLGICLAGILFLLGMLAFVLFWYDQPLLIPVLWVLCGVGPFLLLRAFIRNFEFAAMRFSTVLVLDVLIAALQLGGLYLLIRLGLMRLPLIYGMIGGACAAGCLLWFIKKREPMRWCLRQSVTDWKVNWKFARWALVSHVVGCSSMYLMPWILAAWRGEAATGRLAACDTLIGLSYMFVTAISNGLTPLSAQAFVQEGGTGLVRVLRNTLLLFVAVLTPFCLLILATGDVLVVLVYGESLAGTGLICFVLAVRILFTSMAVVAGNGLWALEKPNANLWGDAATMGGTLLASLVLIPLAGIMGAALAILIGAAAGALVHGVVFFQVLREFQTPIESARPARPVASERTGPATDPLAANQAGASQ